MTQQELAAVAAQFGLSGAIRPYGDGHINDTYVVEDPTARYILQRVNHRVFAHPECLMANIEKVTTYLQQRIAADGGDPLRETLTLCPTLAGQLWYRTPAGDYFRVYRFVEQTVSYTTGGDPDTFYEAACAFGRFQRYLADFPADQLYETIPDFHNTVARVAQLQEAIAADRAGRLKTVENEVAFALKWAPQASIIRDRLADGRLPLRVTHNDTKLNNVLIDAASGRGLCVIDLDTVMPGSALYDFGDAIRGGASAAAEDEPDVSLVYCRMDMFEAFTRGFTSQLGDCLTPAEWDLLAFSARLMTYECGIRFLADYLNGDVYFKVHRPGHNLDRCRTQFRLVEDMEAKAEQLEAIVRACRPQQA